MPEIHEEQDALERARDLLLDEHPEVREQYERLKPRYRAITGLIRRRRAAGLTQAQLAERMGVKQSVISAVESGRRSPRLETLSAAARALGCELVIDFVPAEDSAADDG